MDDVPCRTRVILHVGPRETGEARNGSWNFCNYRIIKKTFGG